MRSRPTTRLLFESGRYLAARAGTYVTSVRYVKQSMGAWFAVTDGGTHHHMAAVGVGSYVKRNFPVRVLNRPDEPATGPWQLTGPLCTPNDTIAKDVLLPHLRPGDLIGILRSGAYGPTASPGLFLSHGFPAEVLVHLGRPHLIRDRDEPADLMRKQRLHRFSAAVVPPDVLEGAGPMDRYMAIEQIRVVTEKVLNREVPDLTADTRLLEELGLDSTGIIEVLMELEDLVAFEVDVDTLDPSVFQTAGSLADYMVQMTAEH